VRRLLTLVWVCLLSACATQNLSDAGTNHRAEVVEADERGLWYEMDRAEQTIAKAAERVKDPALEAYVKAISCEVAPDLCNDIRVYVIRSPQFNAFMAPNGMMAVFTGLWLRSENRSQLANVIGHEVGHFRKRHSLENWRHAKKLSRVMAGIGAVAGGTNAGALAMIGVFANYAAFSRDQEREADEYGFDALAKYGYDPHEAHRLWAGAYEEERANPPGMLSAIFASHPATQDRRDTLRERAQRYPRPPANADRDAEFLALVMKHRTDWLQDELARRNYSQSEVMLKRLAKFPYDQARLHHFLGELYRKRNTKDDLTRAVAAYQLAVAAPTALPESHRDLGLVLRKLNRPEPARAALQMYLTRAPAAKDRAMIEAMIAEGNRP
jgi:beta-barrel assembly-enhancing protease